MIFVESVVALNFDASLSWVKVKNKFKKLWPELALYGKTHRTKLFEVTLSSQPDVTLFVNLFVCTSQSTAVSVHLMYRPIEGIEHMLDLAKTNFFLGLEFI